MKLKLVLAALLAAPTVQATSFTPEVCPSNAQLVATLTACGALTFACLMHKKFVCLGNQSLNDKMVQAARYIGACGRRPNGINPPANGVLPPAPANQQQQQPMAYA